MFCSQCGTKVQSDYKFCPVCGTKVIAQDLETPSTPHVDSQKIKKRMPLWFKILSILVVLALVGVTAGILFTERLVDVVDNQLEALRKNEMTKAYYNYTSQEFQQAISLEEFEEFVNEHPDFANNLSVNFTQRSIKDHVATLKGHLTSKNHENTPIEYQLTKENGKWKISNIQLLQIGAKQLNDPSISVQEVLDTVKNQLKAIKEQDFSFAYKHYTSKKFQKATSEQNFESYANQYPILTKHTSVSLRKPTFKDGTAIVAAILQTEDLAAYMKYYLIQEEGSWKILSMRILSPTEESQQEPIQFRQIKIGKEIDEKGRIIQPQTELTTDSMPIYVNVEIANGKIGESIYLHFKDLESGSSFPPLETSIKENGESIMGFSFSPPIGGWPKGNYQLTVESSTGVQQITQFTID
jgi:ABC-type transporter MlaC component